MTAPLKKIMEELDKLSEEEQENIAELLREEMKWRCALKKPSNLAKEARDEYAKGKTKAQDW